MARYRILKITDGDKHPEFYIQTWGTKYKPWNFLNHYPKDWVYLDKYGKAMYEGIRPNDQEQLKPFSRYDSAKEFLDAIINRTPTKKEVVFDTLTDNPPKETGT